MPANASLGHHPTNGAPSVGIVPPVISGWGLTMTNGQWGYDDKAPNQIVGRVIICFGRIPLGRIKSFDRSQKTVQTFDGATYKLGPPQRQFRASHRSLMRTLGL